MTAFNRIDKIIENSNEIGSCGELGMEQKFYYGPMETRKKAVITAIENGELRMEKTKYYSINYEKEVNIRIENGEWRIENRQVHYIYGGNGLAAVYILNNDNADDGSGTMYYVLKDHLGSITGLVTESGTLAEEYSYDAWGRRRHPDTWAPFTASELGSYTPIIERGYTGHEHMDMFGLINMNGRLYDPVNGRMLSPDNNVQSPFAQSYNKYSYCWNNPLRYKDPGGEMVAGADPYAAMHAYEHQQMLNTIAAQANSQASFNSWENSIWNANFQEFINATALTNSLTRGGGGGGGGAELSVAAGDAVAAGGNPLSVGTVTVFRLDDNNDDNNVPAIVTRTIESTSTSIFGSITVYSEAVLPGSGEGEITFDRNNNLESISYPVGSTNVTVGKDYVMIGMIPNISVGFDTNFNLLININSNTILLLSGYDVTIPSLNMRRCMQRLYKSL